MFEQIVLRVMTCASPPPGPSRLASYERNVQREGLLGAVFDLAHYEQRVSGALVRVSILKGWGCKVSKEPTPSKPHLADCLSTTAFMLVVPRAQQQQQAYMIVSS